VLPRRKSPPYVAKNAPVRVGHPAIGRCGEHRFVILSEVVVRKADDNTVEGSLLPTTDDMRFREFSPASGAKMPSYHNGWFQVVGILRLREKFAKRTSHCAQDDMN